MRTLAAIAGAAVMAAFAVSAAATEEKGEKGGAAKLEGTYTIVSGEENGQAVPKEKYEGAVVHFTKDRITGTDKSKKDFFAATYKLDTSTKPWKIKMKSITPKESEASGLIEQKGESVRIIYALPGAPDPTEFKTQKGQLMFELKKKDEKEK